LSGYRDAEEAFRTRDYGKAVELYFVYLGEFPDDLHAWCNLGISLGRMGRHEDALKCFDRALELKSDSVEALYNRGVALHDLGRKGEELDCYDTVLRIRPGYQMALLKKIETLRELGREDEANILFREFTKRRKSELQDALK
jgi:tetratricopeptide (TPR) repeat protein